MEEGGVDELKWGCVLMSFWVVSLWAASWVVSAGRRPEEEKQYRICSPHALFK
jgi:hypothetical protein